MNVLEKAFIDLLRNYLTIPNNRLFTGSRYIARDLTPCVTIQLADERFIRRDIVEMDQVQYTRKLYSANLWINIWCNTEQERQQLIDDITLRFNQLEASHYSTCNNFQFDGSICSKSKNVCEALTSQCNRAEKKQCPNVEDFVSFFEANNIPLGTFHVNSVTNLDELDESEPLLRTIFRLEMNYYQFYKIGGRAFNSFTIHEELL